MVEEAKRCPVCLLELTAITWQNDAWDQIECPHCGKCHEQVPGVAAAEKGEAHSGSTPLLASAPRLYSERESRGQKAQGRTGLKRLRARLGTAPTPEKENALRPTK